MKRKILFISLVVICLAILASGTIAYFTSEDTAHNVITSGGIDITIIEKTKDENGHLDDFPEEGLTDVMPGTSASKIVSVQNTGKETAWIRVRVTEKLTASDGTALPTLIKDTISVMTFSVDKEKWIEKDGWYYYYAPVSAGAVTDVLFEEIDFAPEMTNIYQECKADIEIYAQAVQTANNGETVLDAMGWPTEVVDS